MINEQISNIAVHSSQDKLTFNFKELFVCNYYSTYYIVGSALFLIKTVYNFKAIKSLRTKSQIHPTLLLCHASVSWLRLRQTFVMIIGQQPKIHCRTSLEDECSWHLGR